MYIVRICEQYHKPTQLFAEVDCSVSDNTATENMTLQAETSSMPGAENWPPKPMCQQQRASDTTSHPPDLPATQLTQAKDLGRLAFVRETGVDV